MVSRMLGRVAVVAMIAIALSGCSVWDNTMSGLGLYGSDDGAAPVARPAAMAAAEHAAPEEGNWCRQVAVQQREQAARNGFDAATQQRRYVSTYRQCLTMTDAPSQP